MSLLITDFLPTLIYTSGKAGKNISPNPTLPSREGLLKKTTRRKREEKDVLREPGEEKEKEKKKQGKKQRLAGGITPRVYGEGVP